MRERPVTVICRYTVKPGREGELMQLLERHWPALHRAGLVTDDRPLYFRGVPDTEASEESHGASSGVIVEIFSWKNEQASELAHQSPQIMSIWEPMGAACAQMEFPHFERFEVAHR
jgi:hypothetical protein